MSELMRSESCQSGPCSSTTTFLPARARTAANTPPAAPAPTMTASTFSFVAMSPPLRRDDVRHVGHADAGEAFDGSVNDVDRVVAQRQIDRCLRGRLPALELVLAQAIDEVVLLGGGEVGIAAAMQRVARALHAGERGTIEVDIGRALATRPQRQQGVVRVDRELLVDEVGDAGLACADRQRLADGF